MNYIDDLSNKVEAIMNGTKVLIAKCVVCNHAVDPDTGIEVKNGYLHRRCIGKL